MKGVHVSTHKSGVTLKTTVPAKGCPGMATKSGNLRKGGK